MGMAGSAWAATYQVTSATGDPTVPGSFANVMAKANADTDPRATIRFKANLGIIYLNDSLTILKPMTLEGPSKGGMPLISGNNTLQGLLVIGPKAKGSLLTRITVDGFGGTGIYVSKGADGCRFESIQISNGSGIGIQLFGSDTQLSDVTIFNMAGTCVAVEGPRTNYSEGSLTSFTGWGVTVGAKGGGSYFSDLYMEMANIIGDAGITLKPGADGCLVERCGIYPVDPFQNNATAIVIESNHNAVYWSTLRGGLSGIRFGQPLGVAWNGGVTTGNSIIGCSASGSYAVVFGPGAQGNWIQGYSWDHYIEGDWQGVVLAHASNYLNTVTGCGISAGYSPVILTGGASYNTIYANSIQDGSIAGIVVGLSGLGASNSNTIQGNEIGVSLVNSAYRRGGDQYCGVLVSGGSAYNMISGNVIGAQETHGVFIYGYDCSNNFIQNNYIGLTNPGLPLSSQGPEAFVGGYGVFLWDTWYNTVHENAFGFTGYGAIGNFGPSNFIDGI